MPLLLRGHDMWTKCFLAAPGLLVDTFAGHECYGRQSIEEPSVTVLPMTTSLAHKCVFWRSPSSIKLSLTVVCCRVVLVCVYLLPLAVPSVIPFSIIITVVAVSATSTLLLIRRFFQTLAWCYSPDAASTTHQD